MPKGHYDRARVKWKRGATVLATHPDPVYRPDISHGELRLAAEVMLAKRKGQDLPEGLHLRALNTLHSLANS